MRGRRARRSAVNATADGCSWQIDHNEPIIVENEMCRLCGRHFIIFYCSRYSCQPDARASLLQCPAGRVEPAPGMGDGGSERRDPVIIECAVTRIREDIGNWVPAIRVPHENRRAQHAHEDGLASGFSWVPGAGTIV